MRLFLEALAGQDVRSVTCREIEAYVAGLYDARTDQDRPYGTATLKIKVRALKRFFEFLEFADIILINPAQYIREPKTREHLPRVVLTEQEARLVLEQPALATGKGVRDRAMMEVLYSTGVRKAEAGGLMLGDVGLAEGLLRINDGKGGKDRVVPLGRIACEYLAHYLEAVRPRLARGQDPGALFLSSRGRKLSKNVVWEMVKKCASQARVAKNVHPHTFRHSCATGMLKNRADIRSIQMKDHFGLLQRC